MDWPTTLTLPLLTLGLGIIWHHSLAGRRIWQVPVLLLPPTMLPLRWGRRLPPARNPIWALSDKPEER